MNQNLGSLIGLTKQKTIARMQISACKHGGITFPHTVISGIGGTGKTALGRAISTELNYHFVEVLGSVFKHSDDIRTALREHSAAASNLRVPLLLFIDEVHQLNRSLQESLYIPMKEWRISTVNGYFSIPRFTLIAATTRMDLLDSNSFLTRFVNKWEVSRYSIEDISCIVAFSLRKQGLTFNSSIVRKVAERCLGIPRNAVNLAHKLYIMTISRGDSKITLSDVRQLFFLEELDNFGLSPIHRKYIKILNNSIINNKHVPVGIGAISAKMRQHEDLVKGSIEPILLELNMVSPTPRGRLITSEGVRYLSTGC